MKSVSDRLTIEEHYGKKIIFLDYKKMKEKDMIELVNKHLEISVQTKLPFLADFSNSYLTPEFMAQVRKVLDQIKDIIGKGALIGIDPVKAMILKGVVLSHAVNFKSFKTIEDGINFLTDKSDE